jgi:hypothetical protein
VSEVPGPVLRVVRGNPTPEELAALVVLAAASGGGETEPAPAKVGGWGDRRSLLRAPLLTGPGAWVAASRPH